MLDRNRLPALFLPWLAWFSIDGVQPVTHDAEGKALDSPAAVLRAAVREHADNWRWGGGKNVLLCVSVEGGRWGG